MSDNLSSFAVIFYVTAAALTAVLAIVEAANGSVGWSIISGIGSVVIAYFAAYLGDTLF